MGKTCIDGLLYVGGAAQEPPCREKVGLGRNHRVLRLEQSTVCQRRIKEKGLQVPIP
jgi:hypothetical protein